MFVYFYGNSVLFVWEVVEYTVFFALLPCVKSALKKSFFFECILRKCL
jgi:hypothetical protein